MAGPLPNAQKRRYNQPTIPTSELPAAGRSGNAPECPYELGPAGCAWWAWGWKLPQAAKWDDGALYVVARRAHLEDELAALSAVEDGPHVLELLGTGAEEAMEALGWLLKALKRHASASTTVMREMRELDNRLGLNPKALAELRWTIGAGEEEPERPKATVARLRAV